MLMLKTSVSLLVKIVGSLECPMFSDSWTGCLSFTDLERWIDLRWFGVQKCYKKVTRDTNEETK